MQLCARRGDELRDCIRRLNLQLRNTAQPWEAQGVALRSKLGRVWSSNCHKAPRHTSVSGPRECPARRPEVHEAYSFVSQHLERGGLTFPCRQIHFHDWSLCAVAIADPIDAGCFEASRSECSRQPRGARAELNGTRASGLLCSLR